MKNIKILMKIERLFSSWHAAVRNRIVAAQLNEAEFIPYIQPIYRSDELIGGEVLLRIKKKGILYTPESYISLIESSEAINDVTCELLKSVKNHFTPYIELLPEGFYLSFNICTKQLNSLRVTKAVIDFNEFFAGKAGVTLEIVERGTIEFDDFALETMQGLTDAGVRFAIDDFGHGSSCLKYIEHTGFSTIKIDKCLTVACNGALVYSAVIDSIVALSASLKINVIAEGIENNEQLELLKCKGVNLFQGYLFSKPLSMRAFCSLI